MLIKVDNKTIVNADYIVETYKSYNQITMYIAEIDKFGYDINFENGELRDEAEKKMLKSYKKGVKFCDISMYSKSI